MLPEARDWRLLGACRQDLQGVKQPEMKTLIPGRNLRRT